MLKSLSRWYKLRRHRLGMGVHSPFAYRVVRDVIYGKGYYYAEPGLRVLTRGFPRRFKREYALMFRFIARLSPQGVRLADSVEPQMEPLVRLADRRPIMGRGLGGYKAGKRILTICEATDLRNGIPPGMLNSGNMLIVRRMEDAHQVLETIRNNMKGGWLFFDRHIALAVSNEHEPLNVTAVKMT